MNSGLNTVQVYKQYTVKVNTVQVYKYGMYNISVKQLKSLFYDILVNI
jgi:hypothetical protein